MPVNGEVPWDCAAHTSAKHDIYRNYLERWFPILLSGSRAYRSVTYAEGFAGPGVYKGGEPGSPVIAMRALVEKVQDSKGVARFLFVDDDPRCVAMLRSTLLNAFPSRPRPDTAMPVRIKRGTCAENLETELDQMGAWGQPIFANLDSWGNAPVPFRLLQRLARNTSSEVIVTLSPQHFVRFVSKMGQSGDSVFGGDPSWRQIASLTSPELKTRHILTCYRAALKSAGFNYLLDFELIPPHGQPLYLIFGTSHELGVQKMKDSLWEVDRTQGVGFRDPRDVQAETLFNLDEPQLGPLTRLLETQIRQRGSVSIFDLRKFALLETVYRPQQVIPAVNQLIHNRVATISSGSSSLRISSIVSLMPDINPSSPDTGRAILR